MCIPHQHELGGRVLANRAPQWLPLDDNTICRIGLVLVANKRHPTFRTETLLADVELVVDDNASVLVFLSRNNAWNQVREDRKSTRLNSSHVKISYAVFCLKK